jgi:glycosyltransferase involved in cell wall biosynthesis
LFLGLGALVVARTRRIPLVWWVQDLHPEIATALELTARQGAAFRVMHGLHDLVLRQAHTVIAISEPQRRTLLEAYPGVRPERVVVLENPATHTSAGQLKDPPSGETLNVTYTGNLGLSQGLGHVLDVAAVVRDLPVRFLIHGNGAAESTLKRAAAREGLDNVEFSGFVADDEFYALLRRSHVLLLVLRPGIDRYSFPSKLWTYFAVGRPVLAWAGPGGAIEETLRQSGAGVFAAWGDVPASRDALTELLDARRRHRLAAAARAFSQSHCTPETHAKQLADVLLAATGAKQ